MPSRRKNRRMRAADASGSPANSALILVDNAKLLLPADGSVTVFRLDRHRRCAHAGRKTPGKAFPPAALPHIFERFYRAPIRHAKAATASDLVFPSHRLSPRPTEAPSR